MKRYFTKTGIELTVINGDGCIAPITATDQIEATLTAEHVESKLRYTLGVAHDEYGSLYYAYDSMLQCVVSMDFSHRSIAQVVVNDLNSKNTNTVA